MKVGVVSLGCDKNRIDTENMLSYLKDDGFELTQLSEDADIIIINTCGFIDSAKQEAIETIFEMAEYKKDKCKYLVVTGCLSQRYMDELQEQMPEVDVFLGTTNYHKLPQVLKELQVNYHRVAIKNSIDDRYFSQKRVLTTPYHYAYLKIAEGCDNKCTYCAIPKIRGKYTSRKLEDIVEEAKNIVDNYGVTELILVAQDVSRYGQDLYGKIMLINLLEELSKLNVKWIRLLYLYPELITDELLDYMSKNPKICKYLDIPCQHISDKILKMMNRRVGKDYIINLFNKIKSYNQFAIRSTFIVGFPQESEENFNELKQFIEDAKLDRCGFFAYSKEDGTPASLLPGQIDEDVKIARQQELYAIQNSIMNSKMMEKVGTIQDVIYESIDYDRQLFEGRSQFDAPDIDAKVFFASKELVEVGKIYKVKITNVDGLDLIGETI